MKPVVAILPLSGRRIDEFGSPAVATDSARRSKQIASGSSDKLCCMVGRATCADHCDRDSDRHIMASYSG